MSNPAIDQLGIRILLWLGSPIPFPQPPEVIQALTVAEVTQSDEGDGFQLTFTLSKDGFADYPLLSDPAFDVFSRVVVAVTTGALPQFLINGVITHHQLDPHSEPGRTTLTLTGRDVSVMMDLEDRNDSFPNQPDFFIVTRTLARYPDLGLIPVVTPTTDVPLEIQRIPRQAETDLQFIRRLALRNGYVFHINPLAPGVNEAVFGPELRTSVPQSAFAMNSMTGDNVTTLAFSNDGMAPTGVTSSSFIEPISKQIIPIPSFPSLRLPPLVLNPTPTKRLDQLRESGNESPSRAFLSSVAKVTNAPEAVTGTGEVDTTRYGSVLKARNLVGVSGVGSYDGFYYLRKVTHHIEIGKYTQSFVMTREGTDSLFPLVVP
jgi:hypothetical protein